VLELSLAGVGRCGRWGVCVGGVGGAGGSDFVKPKISLRTYVYKRASTGSSANLFAVIVYAKIIAEDKYRKN
jgi:hypothetical protein